MLRTVHIQRDRLRSSLDPELVFAFLADLRHAPVWMQAHYRDLETKGGESVVRSKEGPGSAVAQGVVVEVQREPLVARLRDRDRIVEPASLTRLTCVRVEPPRLLRLDHEVLHPARRSGAIYSEFTLRPDGEGGTVLALERGIAISGVGLWAWAGRYAQRHSSAATADVRRTLAAIVSAAGDES